MVTVHVKMIMIDQAHKGPVTGKDKGHELENSRKRRRPFKFKVNGGAVIAGKCPTQLLFPSEIAQVSKYTSRCFAPLPGLALSIPKMSLGTKVRVVCPPELAYGEKGLAPKVPPKTTLILEIELLSFETSADFDV